MLRRCLFIAGALLLSASMWIWVQAIVVPYQQKEAVARNKPRGNLSDLYPRWLGARELLLHHRDPYRADVTREIQIGYYGRALDPTRPDDPKDQQGFAYPVYVVLFLAPTVTLPFATVHRMAFWMLAALTALSVPLWLRTLEWRVSHTEVVGWILLTLSSFPSIQGLKLQQLTLLVAVVMVGSMYALAGRHYVSAGVLLAIATIKPQLAFLMVLWLCIWVLGNWHERQRLLWSFSISMLLLVVAGELLLPGWIAEFRVALKDYYRYTGGGLSVMDVTFSPTAGKIASAILFLLLLFWAWRNRSCSQETPVFRWSICFTLATTLLIIPTYAVYNQLLLLPGVMMAVRMGNQLWQRSRFYRFFCLVTGSAVLWPFLSAACLVMALAFLPGTTVQKAWGLPAFYPSFAIPITVYALLLVSKDILTDKDQIGSASAKGYVLPADFAPGRR